VLQVDVTLSRTAGPASADEVVQVYLSVHNATVPTAKHSLVSFARVSFTDDTPHTLYSSPANEDDDAEEGEEGRQISFTILPEDHAVLRDPDFAQTVEPGLRTVWVGGGQPGTGAPGVSLTFTTEGSAMTVDECANMAGGTGRAATEWSAGNADAHLWSPQ
jgi:hypothetical protein